MIKKSIALFFKSLLGIAFICFLFAGFYWFNNRLFAWEASIFWKQIPFSEEKFKNGSTDIRSQMVVDIIRSERLRELQVDQVRELLGAETGDYYYSDSNLTYQLTKKEGADWILTLVSGENGKIKRIFIRKSCCSISQKILYWIVDKSEPLIQKIRPHNLGFP